MDSRIARLTGEAGLEKRMLLRRFRKATDLTTIDYCQRLRVARAQEMLCMASGSGDRIAWAVGYSVAIAVLPKEFATLSMGKTRSRRARL